MHQVYHDIVTTTGNGFQSGNTFLDHLVHYPTKRLYHETNQITVRVPRCRMSADHTTNKVSPKLRIPNTLLVSQSVPVTPKISVPEKKFHHIWIICSNTLGSIPDKSCNLRIIVGSSCPRISSFNTFSSISWKLK